MEQQHWQQQKMKVGERNISCSFADAKLTIFIQHFEEEKNLRILNVFCGFPDRTRHFGPKVLVIISK